jgi:hypothetical protein
MIEGCPRHPIDDVQESTVVQLSVPFSRMRKITVANGAVFPAEQQTHKYTNDEIPPNYAVVHVLWFHDDYEQYEIDFPTKEEIKFLGVALDHDVL